VLRLKYVHRFPDRHGKVRHYFRRPGFKQIPLPGLPGSEEFMLAYQAALAGQAAPPVEIGSSRTKPGTINALVVAYLKSTDFKDGLAPETQRARRRIIEKFRVQHGDKRVATLGEIHIRKMMAAIERPHARHAWFKTIRAMMKYAVQIWRSDDPTKNIEGVKPKKTPGHHTWTDTEIAQYRDYWPLGTQQRLAMELALETTSRRADVTKIGPQHERNGKLDLRHTKNSQDAFIPITPQLRAAIDACPTKHLTYLHTKAGAPRSAKALGGDFREWCDLAGLPKRCKLHGLRKGGARRLAEAGASAHEIMSVTGHRTLSQVQHYTEAANREKMAAAAITKLRRKHKSRS
jgi:integrase